MGVLMTSESQETDLRAEIPVALKEKLRQNDGTIKDQLVEALEIYFGESQADSRAAIKRQINRYEEQKAKGEQLIADGEDMVSEAESGIERLQQKLQTLDAELTSYDDALDDLLVEMGEQEMSVQPDHGRIKELAAQFNKPTDTVHSDLQARSDLNESFFTAGAPEPDDDDELAWLEADSE
jgi:chromosome segregation ATPase